MLPLFVSRASGRQDIVAVGLPGQIDVDRQAVTNRLAQGLGAIRFDGQPLAVVQRLEP